MTTLQPMRHLCPQHHSRSYREVHPHLQVQRAHLQPAPTSLQNLQIHLQRVHPHPRRSAPTRSARTFIIAGRSRWRLSPFQGRSGDPRSTQGCSETSAPAGFIPSAYDLRLGDAPNLWPRALLYEPFESDAGPPAKQKAHTH